MQHPMLCIHNPTLITLPISYRAFITTIMVWKWNVALNFQSLNQAQGCISGQLDRQLIHRLHFKFSPFPNASNIPLCYSDNMGRAQYLFLQSNKTDDVVDDCIVVCGKLLHYLHHLTDCTCTKKLHKKWIVPEYLFLRELVSESLSPRPQRDGPQTTWLLENLSQRASFTMTYEQHCDLTPKQHRAPPPSASSMTSCSISQMFHCRVVGVSTFQQLSAL